ncbi:MAG: TlyA family RNA methyltransferase [Candidatus Coatesbacteria bacterium]|nr:TlyA family RNA methyltransferase [Candidatus Coatesbacteria bacterium]
MQSPDPKKQRIDRLMVEHGLADSRQRATALLMAGLVSVSGRSVVKPGTQVPIDSEISVRPPPFDFVSRSGEKLRAAIDHFGIEVVGKVCIDVGASTGGFTQCLLERGARLVYAVDVGYGQLAYELRTRPEVVLLERTNIRYLSASRLETRPDLAAIDVSFISLRLVLPKVCELLADAGEALALIKPQFEVGKGQVGKGGIVRDAGLHRSVLREILSFSCESGFGPIGVIPSPLLGQKGNQEYLMLARKQRSGAQDDISKQIDDAISQAFQRGSFSCSRQ